MDVLYTGMAFLAVPGLLLLVGRLSKRPDLERRPHLERVGPDPDGRSIADEAERWLSSQNWPPNRPS